MKFSIITVTYNSEQYLEECLVSVVSQDYADLEYVIVDGGSSDGTLAIIERFAAADSRIRWISEPDEGISDAFNKGLARATGEVIGIRNSDDAYTPGALQVVADACRDHPQCDVFHGDMVRFSGDTPLYALVAGAVGDNIWHEMPLNHPATFVTRRGYDRIGGFDKGLKLAMDYDLVLRLYLAGCGFHHIPRELARMRYGGASDDRFVAVRREVVKVTVRQGYSPLKAWYWFAWCVGMSSVKNLLRKLGLDSLIRLHPRFKYCKRNAAND